MEKPSIDPITGCAHIKSINLNGCKFRVCSACHTEVPKDVEESQVNYCYSCGETFDHTDDDERENDEP